MARPEEPGSLQTGEWRRIQELAERFERACQGASGSAVDLNALLPAPDDPLRRVALDELIKVDMEFRWRRGQIITLEHYLERYPELGPSEEVSARLIYEEYRLSQLHGVNTSLSVYQKRFPKQYEEVQKLIQDGNAQTRMPAADPVSGAASGLNSANPLATGQDAGRIVGAGYKLERKIGSGAFGEVWRGKSRGGVEVAVKIIFRPLDNEEAKSELTAMELIRTLRHPFLLQTHDFWPEQDKLYIVMELADGSLRDRLKACKKLGLPGIPVKELLVYFRQAAEAIDFLHTRRLLHRDIKPDNILFQEQYAKVADFGLARLMSTRRSAKMSGSGTPAYMAPEMWQSQVSQFSDQYCLATSYAELRQGKTLFRGDDIIQLMRAHLQDKPNLAGVPPGEHEVLLRALDKEPDKRFGTCRDFVEALEEVADTGKVVRRDVSHASTGAAERQQPAPHPGVIQEDNWLDPQGGTLRARGTHSPVMPPETPAAPGATDTDDREVPIPTVASASERALPALESHRPSPGAASSRPPSTMTPDRHAAPEAEASSPAGTMRGPAWKTETRAVRGGKKGLLLGLGAGVAVLALVVFLFWNAGASLKIQAAQLAGAHQFDKALEAIDQASVLASFARAGARDQVKELWRNHASGLLLGDKYDEAEKTAGELVQRFPDDDRAVELLDTALKRTIPLLIEKEAFIKAFMRLAPVSPRSKVKDRLIEDLHNQWLNRARKEQTAGNHKAAQDTAQEMLTCFKDDRAADDLRRSARFQIVAVEVRRLKESEQFDAAVARLNEVAPDLLPDDANTLRHEVEHARHEKFHALVEIAERALDAKNYDDCLARLVVAEKQARDDAERTTIQKLRIKAGSGPAAPLLEQVERQFVKGAFAETQQAARQGLARLPEVNPLAQKDVKQKLDTFLVLAWARDPERDEKQSDEMQRLFNQLFDQAAATRLDELARTYVEIADKTHPRWRSQAQVLRGVLARLAPADRGAIESKLDRWKMPVGNAAFSELLTRARTLYDQNDARGCLDLLRKIDPADLTDPVARNEDRALRALATAAQNRPEGPRMLIEALDEGVTVRQDQLALALAKVAVEQPDYRKPAAKILDKLLPGLARTPAKDKADGYAAFLSGLGLRDEGRFEDAAKAMMQAGTVAPEVLASPERAREAADVLNSAAERVSTIDDPLRPFANSADADKAYQWLEKAQALLAARKQELPAAARVKLALAANFKTAPDRKLARALADQLIAKEGTAELALPLLLVRAQVETPERAVVAYADILKKFKKLDRKDRPKIAGKEWFAAVLQPAVTVGDKLPSAKLAEASKAALATCYAAYARFVREHLYEDWTPKDPKQQAFDAYSKAVDLDGSKPEYWIGRAYSRTALARADWDLVKQDADRALALAPANAAAHGLLGYVYLLQSRRDGEADRKKQLAELKAANQSLARAMELSKKDEEDRPTVLLNRSITCLELGNYLDAGNAERKKYLYAARDYAEQTANLRSHPYPEWVLEAWANALEDIALFLGETDRYAEAVEKFTEAINKRRLPQPRPLVGRGRAQYRWGVLGGNKDAAVLTNALADFDNAIKYSPLSREAADAYYWEGMIYRVRHQPKEARAAFAQAIAIGQQHNGKERAMLARQQQVKTTLAEARALIQQQPDETIKQADEAAQLVEQGKKAYGAGEAARLLTEIYRLKADAGLQQATRVKGKALDNILAVVRAAAAKIQEYGDLPQAALVRGLACEYANDTKGALKAYYEGLADYPDQATATHGLLLINRATLRVKSGAKVPRATLLRELRAAVKLVPDDADKASALALASLISFRAANDPGAAPQDRLDAITAGREAIKYAGKTHPDRAGMRLLLAANLYFMAKATPADKDKLPYLIEGIERAREATEMEKLLAPDERTDLHDISQGLRKEKQDVDQRLGGGG